MAIDVYIDKVNSEVLYNDPISGKVTKAKISKKPLKDKASSVVDKDKTIQVLQDKNYFLESKVSTLSIEDWTAYNKVGA